MNAEQILRETIINYFDNDEKADQVIAEFKRRVQAECQQLDGKRCGLVWHRKDGRVTEGFFILIPQDRLAIPTLHDYLENCLRHGCENPQIDGIKRVVERFREWQAANLDAVKTPDLLPDDNAQ